jgi:hypothetical protein
MTKKCSKCQEIKDTFLFGKDRSTKSGLTHDCRSCRNDKQRARLGCKPHPEGWGVKIWVDTDIKKCTSCGLDKPCSEFYEKSEAKRKNKYWSICKVCELKRREQFKTYWRKLRQDRKHRVMSFYSEGQPKCACCGELSVEFLALDHIEGGGGQHRKREKISNMALWAENNGYPPIFRVLCMNCNFSMGAFGFCPHGNIPAITNFKYGNLR